MWPVPADKEAFLQQGLLSPETVSPTSDLRDHGAMGWDGQCQTAVSSGPIF